MGNAMKVCMAESGAELALDESGRLYLDGKEFDFNRTYEGYYAPCLFTAIGRYEGGFLAVGVENPGEHQRIVAYSTLLGGVWQPENLTARVKQGGMGTELREATVPCEVVNHICTDEVSGQTFLLGNQGQVITLNGCPKCVKLSYFGRENIIDGAVSGEKLCLLYEDGTKREVNLHAASQQRLSLEAARRKWKQGAMLVWVGDDSIKQTERVDCFVGIPVQSNQMRVTSLAELPSLLRKTDSSQVLLFACESGVKAEAAAKSARAAGWRESYYVAENMSD